MSLRYGVLSLLLLLIIIFMAFKGFETWMAPLEVTPEKGSPKKPSGKSEGALNPGGDNNPKATPTVTSSNSVAEKNLFHPDRREFPVVAPSVAPAVEPPPVRPQVTLFGVTIVGDYRSASISYPGRPLRKGEREVMTAKIGDPIGQYRLAKILPDRIGLEHPKDSFEVLLYDAKSPKKRVAMKTDNRPTTVISTVPGSSEPSKPGKDQMPGQPGVVQSGVPTGVTPAATPIPGSSRSRRWFETRPPGTHMNPGKGDSEE